METLIKKDVLKVLLFKRTNQNMTEREAVKPFQNVVPIRIANDRLGEVLC